MPIKKALFPVAGLGTRFLPATKANPKEMMPIVDKPLIQFAVEEAIQAGLKELIFVTSSTKRAIEDHFDSHYELEARLFQEEKYELLSTVQTILPAGVSCLYIRQKEPLGLGDAVRCARAAIGDEPFAVLLADDLVEDSANLSQMLATFQSTGQSVLAMEKVKAADSIHYGMLSLGHKKRLKDNIEVYSVRDMLEKPLPHERPSDWGILGRYVLSPSIFDYLDKIGRGQQGEWQLTDALAQLAKQGEVLALPLRGKRHDCGHHLGYLKAILAYGLRHPTVGAAFKAELMSLSNECMESETSSV